MLCYLTEWFTIVLEHRARFGMWKSRDEIYFLAASFRFLKNLWEVVGDEKSSFSIHPRLKLNWCRG